MEYLGAVYCGKKEDCVIFEKYRNLEGLEYAAFICICSGCWSRDGEEKESLCRYVVRRLQEWVRGRMQNSGKADFERLSVGLEEEIRSIWKELGGSAKKEERYWTGGVWIGGSGVVFALGKVYIYQINKLFGRGHARLLCKGDMAKEQLKVLEMEDRVGLLFLSENADLDLGPETLEACLGKGNAENGAWVSKRVRELGQFTGESMGYLTRMEV